MLWRYARAVGPTVLIIAVILTALVLADWLLT